jgi:hypothetical protein
MILSVLVFTTTAQKVGFRNIGSILSPHIHKISCVQRAFKADYTGDDDKLTYPNILAGTIK